MHTKDSKGEPRSWHSEFTQTSNEHIVLKQWRSPAVSHYLALCNTTLPDYSVNVNISSKRPGSQSAVRQKWMVQHSAYAHRVELRAT